MSRRITRNKWEQENRLLRDTRTSTKRDLADAMRHVKVLEDDIANIRPYAHD